MKEQSVNAPVPPKTRSCLPLDIVCVVDVDIIRIELLPLPPVARDGEVLNRARLNLGMQTAIMIVMANDIQRIIAKR